MIVKLLADLTLVVLLIHATPIPPGLDGMDSEVECNRSNLTRFAQKMLESRELMKKYQVTVNVTFQGKEESLKLLTEGHENSYGSLSSSRRSICNWTLKLDYDPKRIPPFIYHSVCSYQTLRINNIKYQCKTIRNPMSVLSLQGCSERGNKEIWTLTSYSVNMGCTFIKVL